MIVTIALLFFARGAEARVWTQLDTPFQAGMNWGCATEASAIEAYTRKEAYPLDCRGGAERVVMVLAYVANERHQFFDGESQGILIALITMEGMPLFSVTPAAAFLEHIGGMGA